MAFAAAAPAQARDSGPRYLAAGGHRWEHLSREEQAVLAPYRAEWDSYPPEYRARLRAGAQRYLRLTPEQREQVQRSREQYQRLSPEEQEQLREQYKKGRPPRNK